MNTLYENAMNKLKIDKSKFTPEDYLKFNAYINGFDTIKIGVYIQLIEDMATYKKYDVIAMWVGDGGLIEYEPEFITGLVKLFGIKE